MKHAIALLSALVIAGIILVASYLNAQHAPQVMPYIIPEVTETELFTEIYPAPPALRPADLNITLE